MSSWRLELKVEVVLRASSASRVEGVIDMIVVNGVVGVIQTVHCTRVVVLTLSTSLLLLLSVVGALSTTALLLLTHDNVVAQH